MIRTLASSLATLAVASIPNFAQDTAPASPASHFTSSSGGYQVDLPASWRAYEFPKKKVYLATLSPTPVPDSETAFPLGVLIERATDYTKAFGWGKAHDVDPSMLAFMAVAKVAYEAGVSAERPSILVKATEASSQDDILRLVDDQKKQRNIQKVPIAVLLSGQAKLSDMETFRYTVLARYGEPECVRHTIVIGITGKQWIRLEGRVTCDAASSIQPQIESVLAGLRLDASWAEK